MRSNSMYLVSASFPVGHGRDPLMTARDVSQVDKLQVIQIFYAVAIEYQHYILS